MNKKTLKYIGLLGTILSLSLINVSAQIASGGGYTLSQTVIAGGGTINDAVNGGYKVEGTNGQSAAGTLGAGGSYAVTGGFWSPNPFAPTAAGVSVSGRVLDVAGSGLFNATITLTGGNLLVPRTTRTNTFGYFRFEDVEAGHFYIVTVRNKKYGFGQESQYISLLDNVTDIVFRAEWEN